MYESSCAFLIWILVEAEPTFDNSHTKHFERERKSHCHSWLATKTRANKLNLFLEDAKLSSVLEQLNEVDLVCQELITSIFVYQHLFKDKDRE